MYLSSPVLYSATQSCWKVADFGLSTESLRQTTISTEHSRGTPGYRAPELLGDIPTFGPQVDIWGLGCILFELVNKEKAFRNDYIVFEYAREKKKLAVSLKESVVPEMKTLLIDFIHSMLNINPEARPSAWELQRSFCVLIETGSASLARETSGLLPVEKRQTSSGENFNHTDLFSK